MWVGDLEDFRRIVSACRELETEATRIAHTEANLERGRDLYLSGYFGSPSEGNASWKQHLASEKIGISEALELRMTSTQFRFSQEFKGSPESVLDKVDFDDLKSVSLKIGSPYSRFETGGFELSLSMDKTDGGSVHAAAPQSDWLILVDGKLKGMLRARRPWFWFVRRNAFLVLAIASTLSLAAISALQTIPRGTIDANAAGLIFLLIVGGMLATGGAIAGIRRLFPAFELHKAGGAARGAQVLKRVAAAVAWVAAIVLPQIYSATFT